MARTIPAHIADETARASVGTVAENAVISTTTTDNAVISTSSVLAIARAEVRDALVEIDADHPGLLPPGAIESAVESVRVEP